MSTSRYSGTQRIDFGAQFGTSQAMHNIRSAMKLGRLQYRTATLRGAERLDTVAGVEYGDASYWWVIAAASDIGWGLQVPAGTVINIPDIGTALKIAVS